MLLSYEWDIAKAQKFLDQKRAETKQPITLTHLVGYCASRALKEQPEINGRLCFGNVSPTA